MASAPLIPSKRLSNVTKATNQSATSLPPYLSQPVKPPCLPPPIQPRMRLQSKVAMVAKKDLVKSDPYTLEEFTKHFQLPQIVRVYTGHYGLTEQLSMSEGEELILFFVKSAKVVEATTRSKSETYYLPLNSSLQFGPCYETNSNPAESDNTYKTIRDLLQRKEGLPIAVKVCNTFSGKSKESSVVKGDIIFPKQVLGKGKSMVLECINKAGKKLKLGLNCAGQFSTNPYDVRMYLLEYIEHVNKFPVQFEIFSDKEQTKKLFYIQTGTVLVLEAPQDFRSYIYSSDILGEHDYPLSELPTIIPIQIQSIEKPGLNMDPIYQKVQHSYENFAPSMIKKNTTMYPAKTYSELKLQQQLYEEVGESSALYYELEPPDAIYEPIPGNSKDLSKQHPSNLTTSIPPLPEQNRCRNPKPVPRRHRTIQSNHPIEKPSIAQTSIPISTNPDTTMTPEENIAYLKTMNVETVLQLLDDMNLAEYKNSFEREQVDGELLVELSKQELEDLGVTKNIHQLRLMKLIDGSSSAKKYEGGIYGTLTSIH